MDTGSSPVYNHHGYWIKVPNYNQGTMYRFIKVFNDKAAKDTDQVFFLTTQVQVLLWLQ